jgi:hypothetical protein
MLRRQKRDAILPAVLFVLLVAFPAWVVADLPPPPNMTPEQRRAWQESENAKWNQYYQTMYPQIEVPPPLPDAKEPDSPSKAVLEKEESPDISPPQSQNDVSAPPTIEKKGCGLFGIVDITVFGFIVFACFHLRRMTKGFKSTPSV